MMQFRFAAIESVNLEQRASATAVVLLGGLISAFLGTEIATIGKSILETDFAGSFLLLALLFIIAFVLMIFFEPATKFKEHKDKSKRPLKDIIMQGSFIVAVSAATTGYVVMSFIMTATPVSMHVMDGHSLHHTKLVLQYRTCTRQSVGLNKYMQLKKLSSDQRSTSVESQGLRLEQFQQR